MDPQETWHQLCEALLALGDDPTDEEVRKDVAYLLEDLARWIRQGGFPPSIASE